MTAPAIRDTDPAAIAARRTDLIAIIARVEAATGPDRELDAEIAAAVGYAVLHGWDEHTGPAYTASLDAAVSLVPAGWDWTVSRGCDDDAFAAASPKMTAHGPEVTAPTPARALAAAALRARATEAGNGE